MGGILSIINNVSICTFACTIITKSCWNTKFCPSVHGLSIYSLHISKLIKFGPDDPVFHCNGLDLSELGPMYAILLCGRLGKQLCLHVLTNVITIWAWAEMIWNSLHVYTQTQNKQPTSNLCMQFFYVGDWESNLAWMS